MGNRSPALLLCALTAAACDQSTGSFHPPAPDAGAEADLATTMTALPDLASPFDLAPPLNPVSLCPVPPMDQLYPGAFPNNPYGPAPAADACIAKRHDAIILLGCPSNNDGTPSTCQTKRADIAVALMQAGLGDRFIPSGAAAHNQWVEAEALRDLLVARGVDPAHILLEPKANHTDENLYYSSRILEAQGWTNALVVSDDAGHLNNTAVCDSNCCVDLGRLTVLAFAIRLANQAVSQKVGHYVRHPWAQAVSMAECQHIEQGLKFMCVNQNQRLACADDFRL